MGKMPVPSSANQFISQDSTPGSITSKSETQAYIGRFAPSPTGELHFGSLVSALASYLDAKHHQGLWLVRMEDLDPPREQPGAATAILKSLEEHGLHWDQSVVYQSSRSVVYEAYLEQLNARHLLYACDCSRQKLQVINGIYDGFCRSRHINPSTPHALRLKVYDLPDSSISDTIQFKDLIQGEQLQSLRTQAGDQILKRKDGLYAYQLAVVVDDIEQGVTHVIRGSDLLEVTARQVFLFNLLKKTHPHYGHVPLATHSTGQKLSKQNLAAALNSQSASLNLWQALAFLGQNPPIDLQNAPVVELLAYATVNWQLKSIHGLTAVAPDNFI